MRKFSLHLPFSVTAFCSGVVAILAVVYIGLIAVVMSYASLTVEFSQSVRDDGTAVAVLEEQYLAAVALITNMNFVEAGYAKPIAQTFVSSAGVTAMR